MKLLEILSAEDKKIKSYLHALRRKKNNPKKSKTTSKDSFIDTTGGMVYYETPGSAGSVNPSTR